MAYAEGRVQRCDNHNGIGYATLSDNLGNIASTDVYGFWYTVYAYPGYALTASAGGFHPNTHYFTESDVSSAWVTICLNAKPPSSTCCFDGGTMVKMANGEDKAIEEIAVGDLVLSWTGRPNRVTDIETPLLGDRSLFAVNGGHCFFTAEHPFWTQDGWKVIDPTANMAEGCQLDVAPMKVGDHLARLPSSWSPIDLGGSAAAKLEIPLESETVRKFNAVTARHPDQTVYNLLLDGDHTYFANGFLVHNKGLW